MHADVLKAGGLQTSPSATNLLLLLKVEKKISPALLGMQML